MVELDVDLENPIDSVCNDPRRGHELFVYIEDESIDIQKRRRPLCKKSLDGTTAIFLAIRLGVEDKVIEKMVQVGGQEMLNIANDYEENILHCAAYFNASPRVFQYLVEGGSGNMLQKKDCLGNTLLHYTCGWINELDVIKYVVQK